MLVVGFSFLFNLEDGDDTSSEMSVLGHYRTTRRYNRGYRNCLKYIEITHSSFIH
jgi:hypothetical protein